MNPDNGPAAVLDRQDPDFGQIIVVNYTTSPGVKLLIPTGDFPGGVAVNPVTNEAVVSLEGTGGLNGTAGHIWVVNLETGNVAPNWSAARRRKAWPSIPPPTRRSSSTSRTVS